jgi:hypothetical protein
MKEEKNEFCPFILKPCKKCYSFKLRSSDVMPFLYYCARHFKECEVYRKLIEDEGTE